MMRKFSFSCTVIIAFILFFSGYAIASKHPDGFMGIKWGTHASRFRIGFYDFEWKLYLEAPVQLERLKLLSKMQDVKELDGFPVEGIQYHFLDKRFSGVTIYFAADAWIEEKAYSDYLVKNFGENYAFDKNLGIAIWNFDDGFQVFAYFDVPRDTRMVLTLLTPQEVKYRR